MIITWWKNRLQRSPPWLRVTMSAALVIGVLVVLIGMMSASVGVIAWTNTERFCILCHEMRNNVYAEFKDTIHDKNRSGVRAVCSDCHVPREPIPLLKRKLGATFELWGAFVTHVIDTKEKFEAHRAVMAQKVWIRMLKTDSLECRNCHKRESMNEEKHSEKARSRHEKAKRENLTCIECHYGIAHTEPEGPGPQELKEAMLKRK